MAGLDRPTSGAILADGVNLATLSPLDLARYRRNTVGMIFQSFNLLPRMTLEENVELPLRLAEVDRSERAERVQEALERVRLTHRVGHRPAELSGGEQQRVAIARAIISEPKIVLADEPTGNLDTKSSENVLALLSQLNRELGQTIVMITHNPEAAAYGHRILHMRDGEVVNGVPTH
jgi:putative ABC transport system ATP-binding protein